MFGTARYLIRSSRKVSLKPTFGYRVFATSSSLLHSHSHGNSNDHSHSHSHSKGHTHSHSSADSVLSTETGGLKNPAIRITWIGLIANVGMAVGKGIGGVLFHSQALIADSMHAVSDLFSDFLTLATISLSSKAPTEYFPNGYGRVEALGSMGVSALLIFAGVSMGWSSLFTMLQNLHLFDSLPDWVASLNIGHGHSHSHAHGESEGGEIADINAAWVALASIGIKEWLYHATMKVSKTTNSQVLVANAWHHRVDSLVSMVAVVTIGAGQLWSVSWLDPLGGLIVSGMIVRAGWGTTKQACYELADCNERLQGDAEEFDNHRDQLNDISQSINVDFTIDDIILIPSGPNYTAHVQLSLSSTATTDLKPIHDQIVSKLHEKNPRLRRVTLTLL